MNREKEPKYVTESDFFKQLFAVDSRVSNAVWDSRKALIWNAINSAAIVAYIVADIFFI